MENIVAHSLEKLYTEFEKADQLFLDSGMKDMDAYEKGLASCRYNTTTIFQSTSRCGFWVIQTAFSPDLRSHCIHSMQ